MGGLWKALVDGRPPNAEERALFRLSLIHVTRTAKDVVQQIYDAAATSALKSGRPA